MSDYSDVDTFCDNSYYSEDEFVQEYDDSDYEGSSQYHSNDEPSDSSNGERLTRLVNETTSNREFDVNSFEINSVNSNYTSASVLDAEFGMKNASAGTLFEHCDYCNSCIRCAPMYGNFIDITDEEREQIDPSTELHFCDICCAKLFHDCVHRIDVNYRRYNKSINENQVDKYTAEVYRRIASTPFGALPVYIAAQDNELVENISEQDLFSNRVVFHNIYRKVVKNIINY